jgi:hypothetical protein
MKYLIWMLLTIIVVVPVVAAPDCPAVVTTALATTDELCETTGRNQACYGNVRVEAEPQPGIENFDFDQAGDRVPVTALQSLRLSPMEVDSGAWGVAMMRLQASIPSSTPEDVTLLMFGDVKLENGVRTPQVTMDVTVSVDEYINVRRLPSTRASIMGALAPGATVQALERLEDSSWIRIQTPDMGIIGWVDASLMTSADDLTALSVTERWTPRYRPMQAFYFESGENNPNCPSAPTSGLLIQTPEGVGRVTLLINEVSIRIGSTAFVEARAGEEMRVSTVEGEVLVEAMGVIHTAIAGSEISVPLDDRNEPSAPPSKPRPYNQTEWESMPVEALEEDVVEIPAPLTNEVIEQVVQSELTAIAPPPDAPTAAPPTPGDEPPLPAPDGSLSLESADDCTWVVNNSTINDVGYTWDAVGSDDSGGGVAPANGSDSFSVRAQTVSITFDVGDGPQSSAASSESCTAEVPATAPASPPATEPVEVTDEATSATESPTDVPPVDETPVAPTSEPPADDPSAEPPPDDPPTPEEGGGDEQAPPPDEEDPPDESSGDDSSSEDPPPEDEGSGE